MAKALGAGLRLLDGGAAHECGDVPARGRAGEGPQRRGGASWAALRAAQPVHELAHQVVWDRDRAPVFFSAFQRAETHLGGGEVDTSPARSASASDIRHPVWASVSAKVWTVGRGWARASAMAQTIHYAYP